MLCRTLETIEFVNKYTKKYKRPNMEVEISQ